MRERIIDATARTLQARKHVLLGLSGGLDSSIVAASMAAAGIDFSCFTLVTPDGSGDERSYARMMAQHLDRNLVEVEERCEDVDILRSFAAHLPRPLARCFAQSGDIVQQRLAAQFGADAYVSGGGGDNVFCYVHSARPLSDRLLCEGPGRGSWRTAKGIALLTDSSLWTVLAKGAKRALFQAHDFTWPTERGFLHEAWGLEATNLSHEWMKTPPGELPGKAQHIAWILGVLNHIEGFERELSLPTLWPLLTQPVVELCLSIPTWAWISDGQNRMIARQAFADLLPPAIINRRSKGSPDSFVIALFEARKTDIWHYLCGGWLADHGIIDADAVHARCTQAAVHRDMSCWEIFRLVDAESWARAGAELHIYRHREDIGTAASLSPKCTTSLLS
ncbi:asparagine synthase-related protein [Sphingobium indicum]|uniref:asparagine synthase-related protein n=1 Tax=Sphingobium indicum TaxID=332055 RepID=UPI0018CAD7C3|nr:asparagine synthase C-terminal domain-containing protein [Sphingobium indicum]